VEGADTARADNLSTLTTYWRTGRHWTERTCSSGLIKTAIRLSASLNPGFREGA
jgi:hypothetical protein